MFFRVPPPPIVFEVLMLDQPQRAFEHVLSQHVSGPYFSCDRKIRLRNALPFIPIIQGSEVRENVPGISFNPYTDCLPFRNTFISRWRVHVFVVAVNPTLKLAREPVLVPSAARIGERLARFTIPVPAGVGRRAKGTVVACI